MNLAPQTRAYLYAGATVLLWSTVASAFKLSLAHLRPAELVFYATACSCAALGMLALTGGRLHGLRDWRRRDLLLSAALGFLNPFAYYLVLFQAYDRLPAQEAQPLNFTWPIVLVLMSIVLLGQRVRPAGLLAMAVSFAGVVVISTRGEVLDWRVTDGLGVALALGSTVIWSLYWILGVRDRRDPLVRLAVNFAFGLAYMGAYAILAGGVRLGPPLPGLLGAAYVGLFEMGLTFALWLQALRLSATTAQVSGLIYLTPFLSLMVISKVVGEPIYPSTVVGLALIIAGILMQQLWAPAAGPKAAA